MGKIVGLLICLIITSAAQAALDDFLNQPTRPTIQQVWQNQQDLESLAKMIPKDMAVYRDLLPRIIFVLENFYPNGRYVFIGRDAARIGEAVEAFYLSVGQKERVTYLGVSTKSFTDVSDMVLRDLLKSHGAALETANLKTEKPYVIIDATTMGPNSQSTRLANVVMTAWRSKKYPWSLIFQKLGVVDLSNRKFYLARDRQALLKAQTSAPDSYYFSNVILSGIANPRAYKIDFEEMLTYDQAWHESFGTISKDQSNKFIAKPGALSSVDDRKTILAGHLWLMKLLKNNKYKTEILKFLSERHVHIAVNSCSQHY